MAAVFELTGSTALLIRGTEGEAVADARRLPAMDGFLQGQRLTLEAGVKGSLADVPDWPAEPGAQATAAYTREVLAGERPLPAAVAAQVEHILHLARA